MLFGSTMLEVAIGMIFVYLLISLLCSAFTELIASILKLRAKDLERGIQRLLSNPQLAESFFNHPLIKPLYEKRKPSYIPARTFSLALWNMATTAAAQARGGQSSPPAATGGTIIAGVTKDLKLLRDTILALPDRDLPGDLKQSLVTLMDEADNNFDKARENIEKWYDDAMDRVSGAFKRRTHWILIGLGLVVAAAMNVDSINIANALSNNPDLRKTVVAAAEKYVNEPLPGSTPTPTPTPSPTPTATPATDATPAAGVAPGATSTPSPTPTPSGETAMQGADFKETTKRIREIRGQIDQLGLPIGWVFEPDMADEKYYKVQPPKDKSQQQKESDPERVVGPTNPDFEKKLYEDDVEAYKKDPRRVPALWSWAMFLKVMGLVLTAFAVSQGAPFWFDLLNKFIVIRSTVKPREKSEVQPSKDRPAPDTEGGDGKNKG